MMKAIIMVAAIVAIASIKRKTKKKTESDATFSPRGS
jgi:hypothetical protein